MDGCTIQKYMDCERSTSLYMWGFLRLTNNIVPKVRPHSRELSMNTTTCRDMQVMIWGEPDLAGYSSRLGYNDAKLA